MSHYRKSIFELVISFLIARWLWERIARKKERNLNSAELEQVVKKVADTNRHWDNL